jgi:hypothetical protein
MIQSTQLQDGAFGKILWLATYASDMYSNYKYCAWIKVIGQVNTCLLPCSYFSTCASYCTISAKWLDEPKISHLYTMFDEIWTKLQGQEVVYRWLVWLRSSSWACISLNDNIILAPDQTSDVGCDHKTLLFSIYNPCWTPIGGLLPGDKTMRGTETKIQTSVLFEMYRAFRWAKLSSCRYNEGSMSTPLLNEMIAIFWKLEKSKAALEDKEKKVLMVVIPLPVIDNIDADEVGATGSFLQGWVTWNQIFLFVDVACCCAMFFPVVWSMRSPRKPSKTEGNAARTLAKLTLFCQFYVVVIRYLYFTQIIVSTLRTITSYKYRWVSIAAEKMSTMAFYMFTFYMFWLSIGTGTRLGLVGSGKGAGLVSSDLGAVSSDQGIFSVFVWDPGGHTKNSLGTSCISRSGECQQRPEIRTPTILPSMKMEKPLKELSL